MGGFGGALAGLSALDQTLNAKQKGVREAGQASSALDQALAKAQRDQQMSQLDMTLKGAHANEANAHADSLRNPKKKYTHVAVSVGGKPMMAMQDEEGNLLDPTTKQPLSGDIQPFSAPPHAGLKEVMRGGKRVYVKEPDAEGQEAPAPPPPSSTIQVLPGSNGAPPQGVVTHGPNLGHTIAIPGVKVGRTNAGSARMVAQKRYVDLMTNALPTIEALHDKVRPAAISMALKAPNLSNPALSDDEQRYLRAMRDFIAGVNHQESGARITKEIWNIGMQRYAPLFADKAGARADKLAAMRQSVQSEQAALSSIAPDADSGPTPIPSSGNPFESLVPKGKRP